MLANGTKENICDPSLGQSDVDDATAWHMMMEQIKSSNLIGEEEKSYTMPWLHKSKVLELCPSYNCIIIKRGSGGYHMHILKMEGG